MIKMQSTLDVADNSGAKKLVCVKVLGGSKARFAEVGDVIVVAVREASPNSKVKKGDTARAVIVRTAKEIRRDNGTYIRFDDNAAVLLTPTAIQSERVSSVLSLVNFGHASI